MSWNESRLKWTSGSGIFNLQVCQLCVSAVKKMQTRTAAIIEVNSISSTIESTGTDSAAPAHGRKRIGSLQVDVINLGKVRNHFGQKAELFFLENIWLSASV